MALTLGNGSTEDNVATLRKLAELSTDLADWLDKGGFAPDWRTVLDNS